VRGQIERGRDSKTGERSDGKRERHREGDILHLMQDLMKRVGGSSEIFCDILRLVMVGLNELLNKLSYMIPLVIYPLVSKNLLNLNILSHDRYLHHLIQFFYYVYFALSR
jgi:hypothetical protein